MLTEIYQVAKYFLIVMCIGKTLESDSSTPSIKWLYIVYTYFTALVLTVCSASACLIKDAG